MDTHRSPRSWASGFIRLALGFPLHLAEINSRLVVQVSDLGGDC